MRLPRSVESDPRAETVRRKLAASARPLWCDGELAVPITPMTEGLSRALQAARSAGRVVRGLEAGEQVLAAEERGQQLADHQSGTARGARVSRLLLVANDGSERFYRRVETLLRRHGARVLGIRIELSGDALGARLFGPGRQARAVLVEHKDAVGSLLLALADDAPRAEPEPGP